MPLPSTSCSPFFSFGHGQLSPGSGWFIVSFTMKGRVLSSVEGSCLPWFVFCSELTFYSLQIVPTLRMVTVIEQENPDERQNLSLQFDY